MTMEEHRVHCFRIADFNIRILFKDDSVNGIHLLPSFEPFRVEDNDDAPLLFQLTVDDTLLPVAEEEKERIRVFDTGNGDTIVDRLPAGGYQYVIKNIRKQSCCLLIADKGFGDCRCALKGSYNMRCFGLNNALMLVYAFATSRHSTVMIHASLVRQNGYGYAFTAKSGTGKSTQVSLWLRHLPDCDLMNDDTPVIRIIDGDAYIYGSPWSGKTPCYRNVKARLGAITGIDRALENSVERLTPIRAFASLLTSCSSMKWDADIFHNTCDTIARLVETTAVYVLHCLPDREAAEVCNRAIRVE